MKPVWLFSSGPVGDPPKPEGEPPEAADLVRLVGAREHHVFSGRLDRGLLGFGEKLVSRVVGAPEGDYRVPAEITEWGRHIARSLEEPVTSA
jgi:menaquinone-dependent protoporphyrinogen oxidase